jgi:hypothetical protein
MKQLSVWLGFMGTQGELFGGIIWQYNFVFGALPRRLQRKPLLPMHMIILNLSTCPTF